MAMKQIDTLLALKMLSYVSGLIANARGGRAIRYRHGDLLAWMDALTIRASNRHRPIA